MDLHTKIIETVRRIANKTFSSNKERGTPFIISENDLCCELYRGLHNPSEYLLTTEWTTKENKKAIGRHDLVIYNKKDVDYSLTKLGKPKNLEINNLIAVFELKVKFSSQSKKVAEEDFRNDIGQLLKVKSEYKYFIYFDYDGVLNKEEVEGYKEKGITIVYANIKDGKLSIF